MKWATFLQIALLIVLAGGATAGGVATYNLTRPDVVVPGPAPGPAPQPVVVVDWKSMIPEAEVRGSIGRFYTDFAEILPVSGIKTGSEFDAAHKLGAVILKRVIGSPTEKYPMANAEIDRRIRTAVGLDPGNIDIATLSAVLKQIGDEILGN